jgi:hypothetical protein
LVKTGRIWIDGLPRELTSRIAGTTPELEASENGLTLTAAGVTPSRGETEKALVGTKI